MFLQPSQSLIVEFYMDSRTCDANLLATAEAFAQRAHDEWNISSWNVLDIDRKQTKMKLFRKILDLASPQILQSGWFRR
jgi:hypothetical protein